MTDNIDQWKMQIEESAEERKKYGFSQSWDRYRRYYRNSYKETQVPVNMIFAIARSVIPRVYFRNPRVMITPNKPGMEFHAETTESVDNWLIHRIGLKKQMKMCVLDTFLYGTSIMKKGYDSEYGYKDPETSREGSITEQQFQEDYERYLNPFEDRTEYNTNVIPGMPWVLRVHPKNFGITPGYKSIDAAPWVYHRFYRHIDQVKKDPKYKNTTDLSATHRKKRGGLHDQKGARTQAEYHRDKNTECEYVEMFEISDLRDGKIKVIATGHNEYLRNENDPLLTYGHKYSAMKWNEDTDGFWGIPEPRILEPQQLELNETRTQFRNHRKLSVLKLLVRKGALTEDELEKLRSGDIGSIIEINADLGQAIQELKPYLSNELLNAANEIRRDIRETAGFSRNQLGDFDTSSRRTATEAEIVQQASQIRIDERRDMAADLLVNIVESLNQYIFAYWQKPRIAKIVGPRGAERWVEFTGPQIRGQYDLRVDADTARARSSERRKHEAQELLGLLSNFPPELVNLGEVLKYVATQYEGIDARRILNIPESQPQPQAPVPLEQLAHEQQIGAPRGATPTGNEANIGQMMQALGGGM